MDIRRSFKDPVGDPLLTLTLALGNDRELHGRVPHSIALLAIEWAPRTPPRTPTLLPNVRRPMPLRAALPDLDSHSMPCQLDKIQPGARDNEGVPHIAHFGGWPTQLLGCPTHSRCVRMSGCCGRMSSLNFSSDADDAIKFVTIPRNSQLRRLSPALHLSPPTNNLPSTRNLLT